MKRQGELFSLAFLLFFAAISLDGDDCGKFKLLGVVFVEQRFEVGAAACFIKAGGANQDELLALAEALGVDGGSTTNHADG
jgi:hypothetical protein